MTQQPIKLSGLTHKSVPETAGYAQKVQPGETFTIDMTPTFEEATRMCIMIIKAGTPQGMAMAENELLRYARELDRLKDQCGTAFDPNDTPLGGE